MYSLAQVRTALEKDSLSDALYKLERFASSNGLNELTEWCKLELNGYDPVHKEQREKNIEFRTLAVQWRDVFNRPAIIDPRLSFISTIPIWAGVSELEPFAETGTGWLFSGVMEELNKYSSVPISGAWIPPEQIQALLKRIRLTARRKLDDNTPRIPNTSLSIHTSPMSRWSWQKRSATFITIFGGIWLLLEPLFAVFGGDGPLSSWGVWRYAVLLTTALLLTIFIELMAYRQGRQQT